MNTVQDWSTWRHPTAGGRSSGAVPVEPAAPVPAVVGAAGTGGGRHAREGSGLGEEDMT
ncbi:hypothetical protein ACFSXZ_14400 [Amycolatopsis pigmentata]|uniref:Uncharacterized protein n=1 Tax=Amycolatopsis pigmentata TaxID=450801 RepID=A0ABW5FUS6_9PSEU